MWMRWTAEAVEDLKRLALEGRSASVIAATLGASSRNAVIGKASRIGIKLMGGGRASALRTMPVGARQTRWAAPRPPGVAKTSGAGALARDPRFSPESRPLAGQESKAAWTFGVAEVGEMRRVTFEDIREFACRWPLGDPRSGQFAYCGLEPARGQPYCTGHCRMAYRPPQARQSARDRQGLGAIPSSWRLS
jgi:GcrA cell cycle regulator